MNALLQYRALAGHSAVRTLAKAAVALVFVMAAAVVSRQGQALAILIIFMGTTGPAIRLVTMKIDGTYERIITSPVEKARFFLLFAVLWTAAVLLPLLPAAGVVAALSGPAAIVPAVLGTVLAVTLGSLAGCAARGLSDAHLLALAAAGLLMALSLLRNPVAAFLPYAALSSPPGPAALALTAVLPAVTVIVLALAASRS